MSSTITKLNIKKHKKKRCSKKDKDNLDVKSRLSEFREEPGENKSLIAFKPTDSDLIQALDEFIDGAYISDQEYSLLYTSPSLQKVFGSPGKKKCFNYIFNRNGICPWCRSDEVFSGKVVSWEYYFDSHQRAYEILELPLFSSDKKIRKFTLYRDITKHKQAEKQLRKTYVTLIEEQVKLKQKNLALNEISRQIDYEKNLMKNNIQKNINRIVLPLVDILKKAINPDRDLYFKMLDKALRNIMTSFMSRLESKYSKLSPRELEICNLIKNELSSKQIAEALNISIQTVNGRRKDIRKKFAITNKKINLSVFLKST